jgi:hypothetical protein
MVDPASAAAPGPAAAPAPASGGSLPLFANPPKPAPAAPSPQQQQQRTADVSAYVKTNDAEAALRGYPSDPSKSVPGADDPKEAADGKPPAPDPKAASIKVGDDLSLSPDEIKGLMAFKAADDLRKSQVPASAADYRHEPSADLKLPDGVQFSGLDVKDPALVDISNWSFKNGLTQQQHSEMLSLYISARARESKQIMDLATAQRAELGVNVGARVDAIGRWVTATFGESTTKPVMASLATAAQVRMMESIIQKYSSQGSATFSQAHRDPGGNGAMDESTWNSMSFGDKQRWQESQGR